MQLWEKILQLALLGSERTHLEPVVEESLRQYRIDPEDPLPQVILSGAASLHQVRRLKIPVITYTQPVPEPAAEEDSFEALPPISLQHLRQILDGRFRPALPEYVQLLVERQFLLPPEFLPDLLDDGLQDPELWEEVQPLLGTRAEWLMALHPQWIGLRPQRDPERWPEAGPEEKKLILGFLRNRDAKQALALLTSVWDETSYRKKLSYLEILEIALGPDDEAFLEKALTDSRKEVRLKAADLLAKIPGSDLIQRIFDELLPLFVVDASKNRLEVNLPKDIPVSTAKDGIQPGVKKGKRSSLKVDWLFECVTRIPAARWMDHFAWTRDELVQQFDRANRADLLLAALGNAALRFGDQQLAESIIRHLVFKNGSIPEELDWKPLVRLLPTEDFQQIVEEFLQRQPGLLEEKHLVSRMLELGKHPWSESISKSIIGGLKQWMSESKTFLWNLWHYKRLLEIAGYCSPVNMLDELSADWPMHAPVWNQWAPDIERMLRILQFRKEMRERLKK